MHSAAAFILVVLAITSAPLKENADCARGQAGQRIEQILQKFEQDDRFSGAVLAARDGQVVAAVGVGSADLAGEAPITPATLFEIASATKQFTAAAILHLQQEGRLSLDDSIAEHLPGVPEDCRQITIRHLLQHTSGIPGTNSRGRGDDLATVLPLFLEGGPQHEPGTHFEYWNQGYALLSEIIARASGKSYTQYLKAVIFEPAGMASTCFTGDKPRKDAVVAVGRSAYGPPRSALEHPYGSYGFQYRGMGGVVTNVWDLWRWDRALYSDKVLAAKARAVFFKPSLNDYALGWHVREHPVAGSMQTHGGGVRGFTCLVRRYPEQDACLFILCNRDDAPLREVAQEIEAVLFSDIKPPQALAAELAAEIAGQYAEGSRKLIIKQDGLITRAEVHWFAEGGPITHAVLRLDDDGEIVVDDGSSELHVDIIRKEGRITGLRVHIDSQRSMLFKRSQ